MVSRPSDGRLYMLAKDSTGNWWLTSAPLPLNGGSSTPTNPDISVKLSDHLDAVKPLNSGVVGGIVYSPADDAVVALMSDGSFRKWTGIGGSNTITSYSPVTANTVIVNDTSRLMYECSGAPNIGKGLVHTADDSFFIEYISGGHVFLGVVTASTMQLTFQADMLTLGLPVGCQHVPVHGHREQWHLLGRLRLRRRARRTVVVDQLPSVRVTGGLQCGKHYPAAHPDHFHYQRHRQRRGRGWRYRKLDRNFVRVNHSRRLWKLHNSRLGERLLYGYT